MVGEPHFLRRYRRPFLLELWILVKSLACKCNANAVIEVAISHTSAWNGKGVTSCHKHTRDEVLWPSAKRGQKSTQPGYLSTASKGAGGERELSPARTPLQQ